MFKHELLDFIATHASPQTAALVQQSFGGESFYIPKRKTDEKQAFIENNFGKMDTRHLARATGLSVRAVQLRLNRPISKGQQQLF